MSKRNSHPPTAVLAESSDDGTAPPPAARMVTGGFAQLVVRAAGIGVLIATAPLVARYLGPARYGELTLILAIVTLLIMIGDFGLPLLASRDWPTLAAVARSSWLRSFWTARLGLAAVTVTIGLVVAGLAPFTSNVRTGLLVALVGVPAALLVNAAVGLFNAQFAPGRGAIPEVAARLTYLLAILLVVLGIGGGVLAIVAAGVVAHLVGTVIMLLIARRAGLLALAGPTIRRGRTMIAQAAPLALIPVLGLIYARSDVLVLATRVSDAEVGVYGVAGRLVEVPITLVAIASGLLVPVLTAARTKEAQRRVHRKALVLLGMGIVPVAVAGALLAKLAVGLIGGSEYLAPTVVPAGSIRPEHAVALLMGAFALMTFGFVNGAVMVARRMHAALFRHFALAIAANLLLTVWLVGRASYVGAATATLLAEALAAVHSTLVVRREIGKLAPIRGLLWPLLAGAAVALAIALAGANPVVQVAAAGAAGLAVIVAAPAVRETLPLLLRRRSRLGHRQEVAG